MSKTIIYNHPLAQVTSVREGDMGVTMQHLKEWEAEFNNRPRKSVPVVFNIYGFTVGKVLKVKIEGNALYGTLLIFSGRDVIESLDDIYTNILSSPLGVTLKWGKDYPNSKAISKGRHQFYGEKS